MKQLIKKHESEISLICFICLAVDMLALVFLGAYKDLFGINSENGPAFLCIGTVLMILFMFLPFAILEIKDTKKIKY